MFCWKLGVHVASTLPRSTFLASSSAEGLDRHACCNFFLGILGFPSETKLRPPTWTLLTSMCRILRQSPCASARAHDANFAAVPRIFQTSFHTGSFLFRMPLWNNRVLMTDRSLQMCDSVANAKMGKGVPKHALATKYQVLGLGLECISLSGL